MNTPLLTSANLLTLFRFPAAPITLWLFLQFQDGPPAPGQSWITIAICVLAMLVFLSDFFDGRVARANNQVSDFGKIMDPIADSTYFMTTLFALSVSPRFAVTIWFPMIILYREIAIQVLRRYAALHGQVLAAGWSGKVKMGVQSIGLAAFSVLLLINDTGIYAIGEPILKACAFWVAGLAALVNALSLIAYMRDLPRLMRQPITPDSP